jgi:hypothetical protein
MPELDPSAVTDQLRAAIAADGRTHYAIAKAAGIEPDILDRFAQGRDVYLTTASKIAAAVGLELVSAKRRNRRRVSSCSA